MAKRIELTLACGDYEIVRALKEGLVVPDGIDLTVLTAMDAAARHWRFLNNREFDVAEVSASSYIMAFDRGLPFTAIPVFLHRRFRHGFAFVNSTKGIRGPADLVGRKVGIQSFQVTATVWLRGILESEYGVPYDAIQWFTELDEDVPFAPPPGLSLSRLPDAQSLEDLLVQGEIDAVLHSDLILPWLQGDPRVARLFPDYKREERAYFRKTGVFPIMHVMGIRPEIVARYPWVPINLFHAFNESKAIAMRRMENPRIVPLAWYRDAWEEQEQILGRDPWQYGLTDGNRASLDALLAYSHGHGLISRRIPVDELFTNVSQGRRRGNEVRI